MFHSVKGNTFAVPQTKSPTGCFTTGSNPYDPKDNEVLLLNVGGELMYVTRDTLTYIPNTILTSICRSTSKNRSKLVYHDENGRIFIDVSSNLFRHALEQLRRWKNRANASADQEILPPSWHVKTEFDEMLVSLGLGKYRQSKRNLLCTSTI